MLPVALHVTDMDKFSPEAQSILASKEMRNLVPPTVDLARQSLIGAHWDQRMVGFLYSLAGSLHCPSLLVYTLL